jgi:hypothetical protein
MTRTLLVATALSLSMALPSLAATDTPASTADSPQAVEGQAARDQGAATLADAKADGSLMPKEASDLIGADVYDGKGEVIGEVSDFVIDENNMDTMKAVSSSSPDVSMQATSGDEDDTAFMVSMTQEELENMAAYDPEEQTFSSWIGSEAEDRKQIMERRVERWEDRVDSADLGEKAEETVTSAWTRVKQTWEKAEGATGEAWQNVQAELNESMNDLQQAWRQATDEQVAETPEQDSAPSQ